MIYLLFTINQLTRMKKLLTIAVMTGVLLTGCKKEDDPAPVPTPTPETVTINSSLRATFKVDGNAVSILETFDVGHVVSNHSNIGVFPSFSTSAYGSGFYNSTSLSDVFDLDKGTLIYQGSEPDSTPFVAFFNNGSYPYADLSNLSENGVTIAYYINGEKWSTDQGTADQTGSTFTISDKKAFDDGWGTLSIKILANFKCKLYNSSGGVKNVTDGVYIGSFER